jgi:hypothetical protein
LQCVSRVNRAICNGQCPTTVLSSP